MTMLQHGLVPSTGGYQIERSLRFNSADSAYLSRTPGSAGNRKTWTWSGWVKRGALGAYSTIFGFVSNDASQQQVLWFRNDDTLQFYIYTGAYTLNLITTQVFRDPSSWYHIVLAQDTTQATDTNRVKIYVNGTQVTAFSTASYPSQNLDGYINSTVAHGIGSFPPALGSYFNGYQADIHLIDGSALTPSSFGENDTDTGVWKPKAYTGSYGTNGFKLTFSDNSGTTSTTLGKDTSGNGNNWTPNNFSVTAGAGNDSLVDTPTPYGTDTGAGGEVRGNYATMNPLQTSSTYVTFSNGNLQVVDTTAAGSYRSAYSTIFATSGKYYFETKITSISGFNAMVGVTSPPPKADSYIEETITGYQGYGYSADGNKYTNDAGSSFGNTYASGDTISVAVDIDAGKVWFAKNGTWQASGDPAAGTNPAFNITTGRAYGFAVGNGSSAGSVQHDCNFGQRAFSYTAPSGFKALCTTNLPTPTIGATSSTRADKYFNTVLYTGNDVIPRSITGFGFAPDFLWQQRRDVGYGSRMFDKVRGAAKQLYVPSTNAEDTYNLVNSFDSDGFTITTLDAGTNPAGGTLVVWGMKANGAGSSNTAGSITSTVSANTTAGFSIVTFTGNGTAGATVGHGLGAAPRMIIVKSRGNARNWLVYHASVGATQFLQLDTTIAATSSTTAWNDTAPSSTVFTLGTSSAGNESGITRVAYCFAPVEGYSAFGSYTGNGSADGPFVYTGFRPAFVLIKGTSSGYIWTIEDNKRDTYNPETRYLQTQSTAAEGIFTTQDFTSNGFKLRTTDTAWNGSGITYIYAAFAEAPFKYALAR